VGSRFGVFVVLFEGVPVLVWIGLTGLGQYKDSALRDFAFLDERFIALTAHVSILL
jgi:hypothetical protein